MKLIIKTTLILIGFWMCGCYQNNTNPSTVEAKYFTDAHIGDDHPYIFPGDSIVFDRYYKAEDEENVADDEYAEDFLFQVPTGITSFKYENEELEDLKVTLKMYCFCGLPVGNIVEGGSITGEKQGSEWKITTDVDLKFIYQYNIDSTFVSNEIHNVSFSGSFSQKSIPSSN